MVGVVGDPFRRQLFLGVRGHRSWMLDMDEDYRPRPERRPLMARGGSTIAGAVMTTEWLQHVPWPGMTATISALAASDCTMRIIGSSAL